MGNQNSTPKHGSPTTHAGGGGSSGSGHHRAHGHASDSPRHQPSHQHHKSNTTRPPISVHNHRAAAPAQPSLAQAHGSTHMENSQALPITSLAASPVGSTKSGSVAVPSRPPEPRQSVPVPVPKSAVGVAAAAAAAAIDTAPSKPVDVPNPTNAIPVAAGAGVGAPATAPTGQTPPLSPFDSSDAGLHSQGSFNNMSFVSRPPRLPLPIEEEVHTPGSPIIAPADIGEPVDAVDLESDSGGMARKTSNLSNTTVDEDDAEELRVDKTRPTVPTRLEWLRGGERVYVTGTIFQWNRKQRLQPVEGRPGVFATTINILPGTHHIRFLVDNNMQTSPDLPTTVDFGNNLVNYIEVSPDDVPGTPQELAEATPQATPAEEKEEAQQQQRRDKDVLPAEAFTRVYPQYLLDYDEPEDSPVSQAAAAAIEKLPTPPSLPGFLAKPILNQATLLKDDNSVLNMPNHTTLNHLATSSIKNGTLAVSATTRYQDKYVTTIMYKPVPGQS